MDARSLLLGLLASALTCAAFATEETSTQVSGTANTPETMEHVEVIGYPTPAPSAQDAATDIPSSAEQLAQQQRQELLRAARQAQLQQLEAFQLEGKRLEGEEVAQQAPEQLKQLEPAALKIEADSELEEEATAIEPTQENQPEQEPLQEPS